MHIVRAVERSRVIIYIVIIIGQQIRIKISAMLAGGKLGKIHK